MPFDFRSYASSHADAHVGRTILRAFHQSIGLSDIIAFAERELQRMKAGKYEELLKVIKDESGIPWHEEKDFTSIITVFARCLS